MDIRPLSTLLDHKYIMEKRIEFMIAKGILNDQSFAERYKNIYEEMYTTKNLIIKISMKSDFTLKDLNNMINKLNECKINEITLIKYILISMGAL